MLNISHQAKLITTERTAASYPCSKLTVSKRSSFSYVQAQASQAQRAEWQELDLTSFLTFDQSSRTLSCRSRRESSSKTKNAHIHTASKLYLIDLSAAEVHLTSAQLKRKAQHHLRIRKKSKVFPVPEQNVRLDQVGRPSEAYDSLLLQWCYHPRTARNKFAILSTTFVQQQSTSS